MLDKSHFFVGISRHGALTSQCIFRFKVGIVLAWACNQAEGPVIKILDDVVKAGSSLFDEVVS